MNIENFIKSCARGIYDRNMNLFQPEEWLEILNFQGGELFPEIGYRGTVTKTIKSLGDNYQLDLSDDDYSSIFDIKEVYMEDSNGKKKLFDNWIYDKELKLLDLDPPSSKSPSLSIASYENVIISWYGYFPSFSKYGETISLTTPKLVLLQNICKKEALNRILYDHTKLDRYRVLVSRMNEYALMAMIDRLETRIELSKRKLVDTNPVKTF